jgi:hypothetical protein
VLVAVPAGAPLGATLKPGRGGVGAVLKGFTTRGGKGPDEPGAVPGAVEAHGGVRPGMRLSSINGWDARDAPTARIFARLRAAAADARARRDASEGGGRGPSSAEPLRLVFGLRGAEALRERAAEAVDAAKARGASRPAPGRRRALERILGTGRR